jgi:bifunctional aspartokinase / homoserine dehydrogenase 1
MKVLKFGGSSIADANCIEQAGAIILSYHQKNQPCCVVVSALKGVTDNLVNLSELAAAGEETYQQQFKSLEERHYEIVRGLIPAQQQSSVFAFLKGHFNELEELLHGIFLLRECSLRTRDLVLSFGERCAAYLVSQYLKTQTIPSEYLDARKVVKTDNQFGSAKVILPDTFTNIARYLEQHPALHVITGFISSTLDNETTTLGRGGSDYTASLFGAALDAEEIEIWTDVDGVMTADPRQVSRAYSLHSMTYLEAMEMSHFGAKVIYPPTMLPVMERNVPLRIRNTFNTDFKGTLITRTTDKNANKQKWQSVKGISSISEIALISLEGSGMVGVPGISQRLFAAMATYNINVILITQASSEHNISIAIDPEHYQTAQLAMAEAFEQEIKSGKIDKPKVEVGLSIVAIIGENMRQTTGVSGKLFSTLGRNGVNIRAIAQGSSEVNLSFIIRQHNLSKTVNILHEAFFLEEIRTLNVFLVGPGLIGNTLLQQIARQRHFLYTNNKVDIRVTGLANRTYMLMNEEGIDPENWKAELQEQGETSNLDEFVSNMKTLNLPNSIFTDCTSSNLVTHHYHDVMLSSISVITPNKLANSGPQKEYNRLKEAARKSGARFLFETNVGAGLPVINVLQDLIDSGDKIIKIEGVLSGTLSYIFNSFKKGVPFSQVVREAKEAGYTEPDPRDDLNGMDVARKILILTRGVGVEIEPEEVRVENILPGACVDAPDTDSFFRALEANDSYFEELLQKAELEGKKLRFIATMEDEKARVELLSVGPDHPFYSLSGSDNIISYTTARYDTRPLVVKGPGAGAEVTAAGVFSEIISIGKYLYQDR